MDQDLQDIKKKLVDIEATIERNHTLLFEAVGIVDHQVGKLTEALGGIAAQLNKRSV